MITSKDILKETGLKNAKTLTRWARAGIIPKPIIQTHPSGRGKIAYWPDHILPHCKRIVQLQKEGHSLSSAALQLNTERIERSVQEVTSRLSITEILSAKDIKLPSGERLNALDAFLRLLNGPLGKCPRPPFHGIRTSSRKPGRVRVRCGMGSAFRSRSGSAAP